MIVKKKISMGMQENTYLVYNEKNEGIIIDPGVEGQVLINWLDELTIDLKAILITHGHGDHIVASDFIRDHYGVKVYVPRGEVPLLERPELNFSLYMTPKGIRAKYDFTIEDGQVLKFADGIEFETIIVPGHSPSSACYYNKYEGIVFVGDTIFRGSIGRTDLYDGDQGDLVRNIRKRLLSLPDETIVYSGHGMKTSIAREKKENPFLRTFF